jgi:hypothetical protein
MALSIQIPYLHYRLFPLLSNDQSLYPWWRSSSQFPIRDLTSHSLAALLDRISFVGDISTTHQYFRSFFFRGVRRVDYCVFEQRSRVSTSFIPANSQRIAVCMYHVCTVIYPWYTAATERERVRVKKKKEQWSTVSPYTYYRHLDAGPCLGLQLCSNQGRFTPWHESSWTELCFALQK